MTKFKKTHPEEEILERFSMGRLVEPELGEFEEHLLICDRCQERLDEATEFTALMREAAGKVAEEAPVESAWRQWLRLDWLPGRMPALAGAMVITDGCSSVAAVARGGAWRVADSGIGDDARRPAPAGGAGRVCAAFAPGCHRT